MQFNFAIEKPLHPLGLASAEVAFRAFGPHNLTAAGNIEAAFSAFVGLKLWHLGFLLPLP